MHRADESRLTRTLGITGTYTPFYLTPVLQLPQVIVPGKHETTVNPA